MLQPHHGCAMARLQGRCLNRDFLNIIFNNPVNPKIKKIGVQTKWQDYRTTVTFSIFKKRVLSCA
jgi:hypothetical protein